MSTGLTIGLSIFLGGLVFLSALFSAAETAYSSVSKVKINSEVIKKCRSAILIQKHYKSFGWTLATILIANNLVNIAASTIITYVLSSHLSGSNATATIISTFVMTPIIVIFGEIIPKLLAKKYSYGYLKKVVYIMEIFKWLFLPFTFIIRKLVVSTKVTHTEDEIANIIDLAKNERVLQKEEARLVKNALLIDSLNVRKIMILRKDVACVSIKDSLIKIKDKFKETRFSRLVVVKDNKFVGIIILKDVIALKKEKWTSLIKKPSLVSQNTIVTKVLETLRSEKLHMAFIVAKGGKRNVIGIVTIEDIMEELVGEIYDEHEKDIDIREISIDKHHVQGSALIKELSKTLDIKFEKVEENQSVKEWVQSRMRSRIKKGHVYIYDEKVIFKVVENTRKNGTVFEVDIK